MLGTLVASGANLVQTSVSTASAVARQPARLARSAAAEVSSILGTRDGAAEAAAGERLPPQWADVAGTGPVLREAVGLAVTCAGLLGAGSARLGRLPAVSPALTAAVVMVDNEPRLRAVLSRWVGRGGAEVGIAMAVALVQGVNGGTSTLTVDVGTRTQSFLAARARREAFLNRRDELCGSPAAEPVSVGERPVPLPAGPVERLADRAAVGSLAAAGALGAVTGSLDAASRAFLVGAPKAARVAQQSFADALTLDWSRGSVLLVDRDAARRFDRVSAVIVDAAALLSSRQIVLDATASADGWSAERVWSAGQRLLGAESGSRRPDPRSGAVALVGGADESARGPTEMLLTADGETVGTLVVGREIDPHAAAVLSAARRAGTLVLTTDPSAEQLMGVADRVIDTRDDPDGDLLRNVRAMQAAGEVVAVVTDSAGALAAADVGIATLRPGRPVPWAADVVGLRGLVDVARILDAFPDAASVSRRGVTLSYGGTSIGALVAAVGSQRRNAGTFPVNAAAASALLAGITAVRRLNRARDPLPVSQVPWHALDAQDVLRRLRVTPGSSGSSGEPADADQRTVPRAVRELRRLVENVRAELADPLTPVLGTGAAASAVIGSPADAMLVSGVLAANAVISGVQRLRAETALRELLSEQRPHARLVERDGTVDTVRTVPADRLRPGDIVELSAADVVPADARLLELDDLEVDESSLTGESGAVLKHLAATPGAGLADRACMVYEGTTVLSGTARAVVVAVGDATEAGRALQLAGTDSPSAGMQARLEEITRTGLPVTLLGGAAVTLLGVLRGQAVRSAIASGVSVAVAAVPEGLPLLATVAQTSAGRRLSQRGLLVRSARALEALGRVDTVCFDKTGTLTEGRLHVVRVAGLSGEWEPGDPQSRRILSSAARACPQPVPDRPFAHATDQAIVAAAHRYLADQLTDSWDELDDVPFQSNRGFSAAVGRAGTQLRLVVKGAPEVLLPRCTHVRDDDGKRAFTHPERRKAEATMHALAEQGLRVLAVARRGLPDTAPVGNGDTVDQVHRLAEDLTFLGFVALADVERPQARETVATLHDAGVSTVMITGDHPVTARTIAERLGIPCEHVVTGPELDRASEDERARLAASASVFARVSPEQKLRIVRALQRSGRVVAMTGDGANDAAAIRSADVGIGMTARGSTSARSAADLVLTAPDVSLLCDALVEGRALWRRVRDAVAILLGGNAGEVTFTLAGTALAGRAPISTRQFLLVNMLTDLLPAMAIAVAATPQDPAERRALLAAGHPSLGAPLLRDIGTRGATTAAGAFTAWQIGRFTGTRGRAATIALVALVATQLGQTLLVDRRNPVVVATGVGSFVALAGIVQTPVVSSFFGCRPLGPVAWTTATGCAIGATGLSVLAPRLFDRADEDNPPDGDDNQVEG